MMADETRIAVWDYRDKERLDGLEARNAWLKRHLPAAPEFTYRVEFYDSPLGPRAKLYSYAPDSEGRRHWNPDHKPHQPHEHRACYVAENPPLFMPLDELPA